MTTITIWINGVAVTLPIDEAQKVFAQLSALFYVASAPLPFVPQWPFQGPICTSTSDRMN